MFFFLKLHQAANFNLDSFESSLWYPHTGLGREKDKEKHDLNGKTPPLRLVFLCLKNLFVCFHLSLISHV